MSRTISLCFALCSFISCLVVIVAMILGKATEISTMPSGALLATFDEHYKTNYTSWRGCDGLWSCGTSICEMAKTPDISFIGVSPTDVIANPNSTDCSLGILYTMNQITSYRPALASFIVIGLSVAFEVMTLCVFCVTFYTKLNGNPVCGVYGSFGSFGILAVLAVAMMIAGHGLYYGFIFYWRHLVGDMAPLYVIIGQFIASACLIISLILSHLLLVIAYCSEVYSVSELQIEISSSAN